MYLEQIRESDVLKPHVEHYDRLIEGDAQKTYQSLSDVTDKVNRERRQRQNKTNAAAGSLFEAKPKLKGAPGPVQDPQPQQQQPKGQPKGSDKGPKGKGKGEGKNKDPKGKGKGNDPKGKGKGDKHPSFAKDPTRSCCHHFFGTCKCDNVKIGQSCFYGIHREQPSEADKASQAFKNFEAQHGSWNKNMMKTTAAPARQQRANGGDTPVGSPRGGAAGGDAAE